MHRVLVLATLVLTGLVTVTVAADTIADLDLSFIRDTDETAAVLCYDDEGKDCGIWATHYLWEARVRRYIDGNKLPKRFKVLFGRHALLKVDFRLTRAKVVEAKGSQSDLAPYVIVEVENFETLPNKSLERMRDK